LRQVIRTVPRLFKALSNDGQHCTPELLPVLRLKLFIDILAILLADTDEMAPRANIAIFMPNLFKLLRALQTTDTDRTSLVNGLTASSVLLLCAMVDTVAPQKKALAAQDVCKSAQAIILLQGPENLVMTSKSFQRFESEMPT
jgi:hypothetical protein